MLHFRNKEVNRNISIKIFSFILSICLISTCLGGWQVSAATEISPSEYYGRTALSKMQNGEAYVYAYDQLAEGIGAGKISISVRDSDHNVLFDDFRDIVIHAYINDYPQHFWMKNSYSYSTIPHESGKVISTFYPDYLLTGNSLATAKAAVEKKVSEILAGITPDMSEFEIELYFHDYLAENIVYDQTLAGTHCRNIYGALVEGLCVCEGYAEALQYLLYRAGILSHRVTGDAGGGHAWNVVRIDGEFYQVDLTWDDPTYDDGVQRTSYEYFNITTARISEDHTLDAVPYGFPVCTATENHYYNVMGIVLDDDYTVEEIAGELARSGMDAHIYLNETADTTVFWEYVKANVSSIASRLSMMGSYSYGGSYGKRGINLYFIGNRLGDVNGDGGLNFWDLQAWAEHLNGTNVITDQTLLKAADVNKDGNADEQDSPLLADQLSGNEVFAIATPYTMPQLDGRTSTGITAPQQVSRGDELVCKVSLIPPTNGSVSVFRLILDAPEGTSITNIAFTNAFSLPVLLSGNDPSKNPDLDLFDDGVDAEFMFAGGTVTAEQEILTVTLKINENAADSISVSSYIIESANDKGLYTKTAESGIEVTVLQSEAPTPDDTTPDDTIPDDTTPDDTTPDDTTPDDTTPDDTTPDDTTPDDTTPDDTTPDDTTPDDTTPDDTMPDDTTPDDTMPDDTTPDDTTPDDTKPDDTTPDDTKPDDTTPDDTTPNDTTPVDPQLDLEITPGEDNTCVVDGLTTDSVQTELVIPSTIEQFTVTAIAQNAFAGSAVVSVTLPSTLQSIGAGAFDNCADLADVYFEGTREQWEQITVGANNQALLNATIHFAVEEQPDVTPTDLGDVNGDKTVDAKDALAVLKHAVGKDVLPEDKVKLADMNNDGNIDAKDALAMLKIAVGK